jgi:uncharacterized phage protein (TIGR01671 family)
MREIKFRVWDEERGEMHDNLAIGDGWLNTFFKTMPGYKNPEKWHLMQFTGLKDKDGNEIYEGDIVGKWGDAIWEVGFLDGEFCFVYPESHRKSFRMSPSSLNGKQIIGNIHENLELLR